MTDVSVSAREVSQGLSPREAEVLSLVAQGLTSRQVAEMLFVSKRTVDFHLDSIYTKWGVNNRLLAIREAQRRGLVAPPSPASPGNQAA